MTDESLARVVAIARRMAGASPKLYVTDYHNAGYYATRNAPGAAYR